MLVSQFRQRLLSFLCLDSISLAGFSRLPSFPLVKSRQFYLVGSHLYVSAHLARSSPASCGQAFLLPMLFHVVRLALVHESADVHCPCPPRFPVLSPQLFYCAARASLSLSGGQARVLPAPGPLLPVPGLKPSIRADLARWLWPALSRFRCYLLLVSPV